MLRLKFTSAILSIIFISILGIGTVAAQGLPINGQGIDLSVSTDNPIPGQNITITARSYSIDINASNLTWYVNGKVAQKGLGLTTLTTVAPAAGKKLSIKVSVATPNTGTLTGTMNIGSGSVDMIIEPNSFIPPLFRGKNGIAYQNTIKVVAMPHLADSNGVDYDPKTFIYRWKRNGQVLEDQSGYGKQAISLTGDMVPRSFGLTVDVSTKDSSAQGTGYISIDAGSPIVMFYLNDPLYGPLYNQAINGKIRIGSQKEIGVVAIPYGFNKPLSNLGNLAFDWSINGQSSTDLSNKQTIVLRAPENTSGSSAIQLNVTNGQQILQSYKNGFDAYFKAGNTTAPSATSIIY